ncbi:MAG: hypothetical protein CL434_04830 [Acidimicrobiaceae bacterium]|jgi:hypothetical protein|nr:hypothetical protein [Acidimicrobiaceae bacterium]|tara:strand:+ start:1037 stop:1357 length:321 start_codon:yes stop_codon:yes gene_type:complete
MGFDSDSRGRWFEPRSLNDVLKRIIGDFGDSGAMYAIHEHWNEAVGSTIAQHCSPRRLLDGELLIEVDHPGWATEIQYLEQVLITKLAQLHPKLDLRQIRVQVKGS